MTGNAFKANADNVEKYKKIGPQAVERAFSEIESHLKTEIESPVKVLLGLGQKGQSSVISKTIDDAKALLKNLEERRDEFFKLKDEDSAKAGTSINKIYLSLFNSLTKVENVSKNENGIESLGLASDLASLYNCMAMASMADSIAEKSLGLQKPLGISGETLNFYDSWIANSKDKKAVELREKWETRFGKYEKGAYANAIKTLSQELMFQADNSIKSSFESLNGLAEILKEISSDSEIENETANKITLAIIDANVMLEFLEKAEQEKDKLDLMAKTVDFGISKIENARKMQGQWQGLVAGIGEDDRISLSQEAKQFSKKIESLESTVHVALVNYFVELDIAKDRINPLFAQFASNSQDTQDIIQLKEDIAYYEDCLKDGIEKINNETTGKEESIQDLLSKAYADLEKLKAQNNSYDAENASNLLGSFYQELKGNHLAFQKDFEKFEKYYNLAERTKPNLITMVPGIGPVIGIARDIGSQIENSDTYKAKIDYFLSEGWLSLMGLEKSQFQEIKESASVLSEKFKEVEKQYEELKNIQKIGDIHAQFNALQKLSKAWSEYTMALNSLKLTIDKYDLDGTEYVMPAIFKCLDVATVPLIITGAGSVAAQGGKFALKEIAEQGLKQGTKTIIKTGASKSLPVIRSALIGAGIGAGFATTSIGYDYLMKDSNFSKAVELFEKDNIKSVECLENMLDSVARKAGSLGLDDLKNAAKTEKEEVKKYRENIENEKNMVLPNKADALSIIGRAALFGLAIGLISVSPKSLKTADMRKAGAAVKTSEVATATIPAKYAKTDYAFWNEISAKISEKLKIEFAKKSELSAYEKWKNVLKDIDAELTAKLKKGEIETTEYGIWKNTYERISNELNSEMQMNKSVFDKLEPKIISKDNALGNRMIKASSDSNLKELKNVMKEESALQYINHINPKTRMSALDYAVRNSNKEMVEFLIGKGANITKDTFEWAILASKTKEGGAILKLVKDNQAAYEKLIGTETPLSLYEQTQSAIQKQEINKNINALEDLLTSAKGAQKSGKIINADLINLQRFWQELNNKLEIDQWQTRDGFGKAVATRWDFFDNKQKFNELQNKIIADLIGKLRQANKSGNWDELNRICEIVETASGKLKLIKDENLRNNFSSTINEIKKAAAEIENVEKSLAAKTGKKNMDEISSGQKANEIKNTEKPNADSDLTLEEQAFLSKINLGKLSWLSKTLRGAKVKKHNLFEEMPGQFENLINQGERFAYFKNLEAKIKKLEEEAKNSSGKKKKEIFSELQKTKDELANAKKTGENATSNLKMIDKELTSIYLEEGKLMRKALIGHGETPVETIKRLFKFDDRIFHGRLFNPFIIRGGNLRIPSARAKLLQKAETKLFEGVSMTDESRISADKIINTIKSRRETIESEALDGNRSIIPGAGTLSKKIMDEPIQLLQKTNPKAWETKSTWDNVVEQTVEWCIANKNYKPLLNLSDIMVESGFFSPGKITLPARMLPWFKNKTYDIRTGETLSKIEITGFKSYMRKVVIPQSIKNIEDFQKIKNIEKKLLARREFYEGEFYKTTKIAPSNFRITTNKAVKYASETLRAAGDTFKKGKQGVKGFFTERKGWKAPYKYADPAIIGGRLESSYGYPSVMARATYRFAKPIVVWGILVPTAASFALTGYLSIYTIGDAGKDAYERITYRKEQKQEAAENINKGNVENVLTTNTQIPDMTEKEAEFINSKKDKKRAESALIYADRNINDAETWYNSEGDTYLKKISDMLKNQKTEKQIFQKVKETTTEYEKYYNIDNIINELKDLVENTNIDALKAYFDIEEEKTSKNQNNQNRTVKGSTK